jgi:hypothetical protein
MTSADTTKPTDLVQRSIGPLVEALGFAPVLAAVSCTAGGAVLASIPTAASLILRVNDEYSAKRRHENLCRVLEQTNKRLAAIERTVTEVEEVDLFRHLLEVAAAADDQSKLQYHSIVLAWSIEAKRDPLEVRLLSDAVHRLSSAELHAFVRWMNQESPHPIPAPSPISEGMLRSRLESAGLIESKTVSPARELTRIGRVLVDGCKQLQ